MNNATEEIRYAEIAISEVKKLICILYGTVVRFYLPVLKFEDLHEMREDLIEVLTSLTIKDEMSKIIIYLCRMSSKIEEG